MSKVTLISFRGMFIEYQIHLAPIDDCFLLFTPFVGMAVKYDWMRWS